MKRLAVCWMILAVLAISGAAGAWESMVSAHVERVYAASEIQTDEEQTVLSHEITHASPHYVSVVFRQSFSGGNGLHERIWADTLALDGYYRGQELTVSQVLGLETQETEAELASELVYRLIWQIIQQESLEPETAYLEGLTPDGLKAAFNPETDFYLDEMDNIVFFIQAGEIAGEMAGTLLFPFAPAEMLTAIHE